MKTDPTLIPPQISHEVALQLKVGDHVVYADGETIQLVEITEVVLVDSRWPDEGPWFLCTDRDLNDDHSANWPYTRDLYCSWGWLHL